MSILLIVLLHAGIVLTGVGVESPTLRRVDDVTGHLRIPLFFAASGLLAARWPAASWRTLFTGRLALLLWVFVAWQPIVLAYKLAEWHFLRDVLAEEWAWQSVQTLLSPLRPAGELWFLWALSVFLILAKATWRLPAAWRIGVPALASFAWTAFVEPTWGVEIAVVLGSGWGAVVKYYVFFVAAVTFSAQIRRLVSATPVWAAALVALVWIVATYWLLRSGIDPRWLRFGLYATGVVAGFALGRALAWFAPLVALGRRTLPVYVAHLALIVTVVVVMDAVGLLPLAHAAPEVATLVLTALAIVGALLLHRALTATRAGSLLYAPPSWFVALGRRGARDADVSRPRGRRERTAGEPTM